MQTQVSDIADHLELRVLAEMTRANGGPWDALGGAPDIAICARRENGTGESCVPEREEARLVRPLCRDSFECRASVVLSGDGAFSITVYDVDIASNDTIGSGRCSDVQCHLGRAWVSVDYLDDASPSDWSDSENEALPAIVEETRRYARARDFAGLTRVLHRDAFLQTDDEGSFMRGARGVRAGLAHPAFVQHLQEALKVCRFNAGRDEVLCTPEVFDEDAFDADDYENFVAVFAPGRRGWGLQLFGRPNDINFEELSGDDE